MPDPTESALLRIAAALERLAPPAPSPPDSSDGDVFVWEPAERRLRPVRHVNRVPIGLLRGIDRARDTLLGNTRRFAKRLSTNNVLLWGARGMGKSSLVKAVHAQVVAEGFVYLALVEIRREDIDTLSALLAALDGSPRRWIVFCDDLSFAAGDGFRSLKSALEGESRATLTISCCTPRPTCAT